jgi:ABC-type transporter Mla maintaining outer membrane lipid asymmetry ATPase subunit MlaF
MHPGLIEPDAGTIEIDGQDLLRMEPREQEAVRGAIGMLFQNGALFDSLPVWENVAFGLLARHKRDPGQARRRAGEILAAGRAGGRAWASFVAGRAVGRHAEARRARAGDCRQAGDAVLR